MFYQDFPRDFYDPGLPPWLPAPPPPTAEQAHMILVMWLVTWGIWLAFLLWKDRDGIKLAMLLMKYLMRRYVLRSKAIHHDHETEAAEEVGRAGV